MYTAYINDNLFFTTDSDQDIYELTSAKLDLSIGTAGSFTFVIPPCNTAYGNLHKLIDYIDVYRDGNLIFAGRIYSIEETFDTQLRVTCEGLLAVLNDSIFRPITFQGDLHDLVEDILTSHNAQVETGKQIEVGTLLIDDDPCYRAYQDYETSISRLQDLTDAYGGWIRIRKANGTLYLDWYKYNIDGTSQLIDFGKNLLDITQQEDAEGVITVLIPLGAADGDNIRVDIKSVNSNLDYLEASSEYIQKYGYIVGSEVWEDVHDPQILKTKGQSWLNACLAPRVTINLTAVDLADAGYDVDCFTVGQKIKVKSLPHGITGEWFDCNTQSLDLLNPANNKLSLGTEKVGYVRAARSLSAEVRSSIERICGTYPSKTYMDEAINNATSLITGNSGGHIVLHDSDGDGEPDELLVMDTDSIETAVKVWRFNTSGLGYSSTGYDGTYGLAMTMDGAIVADRITAGKLDAGRIKAGILQAMNGGSYWNLETGEFYIAGAVETDKSRVFGFEPVPPYYYGDLWFTGNEDYTAIAGKAIAGQAKAGWGGDVFMCIALRETGNFSMNDWQKTVDYVKEGDLTEVRQLLKQTEVRVDSQKAEIELEVSEETLTGDYLVGRINLTSTTAMISASHIDLRGAVTISTLSSDTKEAMTTDTVCVYYRSTSNETPTISPNSSIGTSAGTDNAWEYVMPAPKRNCYFFTCERSVTANGSVKFSTVRPLSNATYTSMWCSSADATTIDGGAIYTGSVTADKISVSDLSALNATIGGWTIGSSAIYHGTNSMSSTTAGTYIGLSGIRQYKSSSAYVNIKDGVVTAIGASITGTITASGGYIGGTNGWKITSNAIYNGTSSMSSTTQGTFIGINGIRNYYSASKYVNIQAGILTAAGVNITGVINTSSGKIGGWSITSTQIFKESIRNNDTYKVRLYAPPSPSATDIAILVTGGTVTSPDTSWHYYGEWYWSDESDWTPGGSGLITLYVLEKDDGTKSDGVDYTTAQQMCPTFPSVETRGDHSSTAQSYTKILYNGALYSTDIYYNNLHNQSDRNLKMDIQTLDLEKAARFVLSQNPCRFKFKNAPDILHHGLIAQDVETSALYDDWGIVATDYEGYKSLNYVEIIPDLIATCKYQQNQIVAMQKRISALEGGQCEYQGV